MISRTKITQLLNTPTDLYVYRTLSSTNDFLKNAPEHNKDVLVIAQAQTNGKGRFGKTFYSPTGGMYISYRIPKNKTPEHLIMASALSIIKTVEAFNIEASIKWLNDIYIQNKKVAGILCEATATHYIIGIGLNIAIQIPQELPNITSLNLHSTHTIDINEAIAHTINTLNHYLTIEEKDVLAEYKRHSFILNKSFIVKEKEYTAIDILANGTLKTLDTDKNMVIFDFSTTSIERIIYEN